MDNAATSWPKPDSVYAAVDNYQRTLGASAGRSAYGSATAVARLVDQARAAIANLIGASKPAEIAFAFNGTDALNMAIHGCLLGVDVGVPNHVVTTVIEHNSVLRPLSDLQKRRNIDVTFVDCDDAGCVDPIAVLASIRPETRLVIVSQASNVTGAIQRIDELAGFLVQHDALLLVDAAQGLGHLEVNVQSGIDLLASSGHKGLMGPLGTGVLYVGANAADSIASIRQGGTGTSSEVDTQPTTLPEKLESGNLNVPGIIGMLAGVNAIREQGLPSLREHEVGLTERLLAGLNEDKRITVYGPKSAADRTGVVSFSLDGHDPHELATLLDAIAGIETRSGLHCAPKMHQRLGTAGSGGTVRASVGAFNTVADVELLLSTLGQL